MKAILKRWGYSEKETLGVLTIYDDKKVYFSCCTLELPYLSNQKNISCIPKGLYKVVPRKSPKYGKHLHVTNVPNRKWILFHKGNYHFQIRGCILVGDSHTDINNDQLKDVTNSKKTMKNILKVAPNGFELEIL
tara:strand:- start:42 stop:443 length:402 start_codon:yes stop_codon:yes gene_type:complete